jgi:hypothetical protein
MPTSNDQVTNANAEFKSLLADLRGHRESAFVIRLVESLVKLTGSEEDAAEIEAANRPDPIEAQRAALRAKAQELLQTASSLQ